MAKTIPEHNIDGPRSSVAALPSQHLVSGPATTGRAAAPPLNPLGSLLASVVAREAAPTDPAAVTRDVFAAIQDRLATPILLVDRQLTVLHKNQAAAAVLSAKLGIHSVNDRLEMEAACKTKLLCAVRAVLAGRVRVSARSGLR